MINSCAVSNGHDEMMLIDERKTNENRNNSSNYRNIYDI